MPKNRAFRRTPRMWRLVPLFVILGLGSFVAGTRLLPTRPSPPIHPLTGRQIAGIATDANWLDRTAREQEEEPDPEPAGVIMNLLAFAVAATLEIAGCFAFWQWLRVGRSPLVALAGVVSLIGFAALLTRVEAPFAGRAYAAYGGVYIAASLVWLMIVEGQRPKSTDVVGAAIAVVGAIIIIGFGGRP